MLIDLHSHQPAECSSRLLRIMSLRPIELETMSMPSQREGWYSCGLHPCYLEDMKVSTLERLVALVGSDKHICAIGEAGLDKRAEVSMSMQRMLLERQIELSETTHLPLVIHCVQSWDILMDMYRVLSPHQPWVVHGYRKGRVLADQLLSLGMWLSFGSLYQPDSLRLAYEAGCMTLETDDSGGSIEDVYRSVALDLDLDLDTLEQTLCKALRARLLPRLWD